MRVPAEYLCLMCESELRLLGPSGQLDDLCVGCLGAMNRQRALEQRHAELKDLVWRLADTDERAVDLKRMLQLVCDWPELVEELRERLAVATVGA